MGVPMLYIAECAELLTYTLRPLKCHGSTLCTSPRRCCF